MAVVRRGPRGGVGGRARVHHGREVDAASGRLHRVARGRPGGGVAGRSDVGLRLRRGAHDSRLASGRGCGRAGADLGGARPRGRGARGQDQRPPRCRGGVGGGSGRGHGTHREADVAQEHDAAPPAALVDGAAHGSGRRGRRGRRGVLGRLRMRVCIYIYICVYREREM